MRLFLSSYRAGKHDDALKKFIGNINKIAVITNAKDYKTPIDRSEKIEESFNYYYSLDLEPTEIDLRPFFHKSGAAQLLSEHSFVWLAGGNVFLLRRALYYSGLDKFLYDKVRKNEIILGGESAGAIIMGPTLKYSEMDTEEDSPDYIPEGYHKDVLTDGLNFVNYVPVPHYQSIDFAAEIDTYIAKLSHHAIPFKVLTDEQAIAINGDKEEFLE